VGKIKKDMLKEAYMNENEIKEIKTHLDTALSEMKSLVDTRDEEIKKYGRATEETGAKISDLDKTISQIKADGDGAVAEFKKRLDDLEVKFNRPGGPGEERKSFSQRFMENESVKNVISGKSRNSEPVNIGSFFERKDLSTNSAGTGIDIDGMRIPGIIYDPAQRPQFLRDIMMVGTTQSNSVDFIQETLYTNTAAQVDDHLLSVANRKGGSYNKPESDFAFELQQNPVVTLAHWVPATNQAIADEPMLLSYVQGRLIYGLKLEEDDQILNGVGGAGNIMGFMNHANVQTFAGADPGDNRIDVLRKMIRDARLAEYPVDRIILNPSDWADIELEKGSGDGQYLWINPGLGGTGSIWRVPVFETTAMEEGNVLVGNFAMGASLWDRQQSTIRISDSHANYFIQNLLAILAEERITLTIFRPQAFVKAVFAS
jgi:HK97 family phage major capsid protein